MSKNGLMTLINVKYSETLTRLQLSGLMILSGTLPIRRKVRYLNLGCYPFRKMFLKLIKFTKNSFVEAAIAFSVILTLYPLQVSDPFGATPVSNNVTGVTYKNYHCALCNNDVRNISFWKSRVECPSLTSYSTKLKNKTKFIEENLTFNMDR